MSCKHPFFRVPIEAPSYRLLHQSDRKREKNGGVFFWDIKAADTLKEIPGFNFDEVQQLRCGQCIDCRLAYSRDWAIRCSLEASLHQFNYFVTLTYNDLCIPKGNYIDYEGTLYNSTLCKADVQKFVKNLREFERTHYGNTDIKVFYCGEYGGDTGRPHYHLCLFGVSQIPDLSFKFKKGSYNYYKSELYESFWTDRVELEPGKKTRVLRGFVDIADVSFDSIAYTARYCLKKIQGKGKKDFLSYYESLEGDDKPELRLPTFLQMSLKPAIAYDFYQNNKLQIQEEDLVKYQKKFDLFKAKPPRYFDKLFDREDPERFAEVKERRRIAGLAAAKLKESQYSEPTDQRLAREERILLDKERLHYQRHL